MIKVKEVTDPKEVTKTGLYRVSNDAYHAGKGISSTSIKDMLRSPAHFLEAKNNPKTTPAMEFGTMIHTYLLEPEEFEKDYAIEPDIQDPKTKEPGKSQWKAFKESANGKKIVTRDQFNALKGMASAYQNHTYASKIRESCTIEVSAYDIGETIVRKARADMIDLENGIIWDLKSTQDARKSEFTKAIANYKYHLSAAYYLDVFSAALGSDIKKFGWIAIEKTAPNGIGVYIADDWVIEIGRKEYQKALKVYDKCVETHDYPCYKEAIESISLPHWYNLEEYL